MITNCYVSWFTELILVTGNQYFHHTGTTRVIWTPCIKTDCINYDPLLFVECIFLWFQSFISNRIVRYDSLGRILKMKEWGWAFQLSLALKVMQKLQVLSSFSCLLMPSYSKSSVTYPCVMLHKTENAKIRSLDGYNEQDPGKTNLGNAGGRNIWVCSR